MSISAIDAILGPEQPLAPTDSTPDDAEALDLAVRAHVRHAHTEYDRLLGRGWERAEARAAVAAKVAEVMERWSRGPGEAA